MSTFVVDVAQEYFNRDVIERSKTVPVVVDFWAEWCGPCKQLSPVLERLADEYNGGFVLAKIDVDANQQLAAQMGVQGIPAVVAFVDGQPVNSFQGALPEAQVRQWLDSVAAPLASETLNEAMRRLDAGDEVAAEELLRRELASSGDPEAGLMLATLLIDQERMDDALTVLDGMAPSPEVEQLRSIAQMSEAAGHLDELEAQLAERPDDEELQIAHAKALAGSGRPEPALQRLLTIVEGRGDHADAAREAMISIFDALGATNPVTQEYRKRLANALF